MPRMHGKLYSSVYLIVPVSYVGLGTETGEHRPTNLAYTVENSLNKVSSDTQGCLLTSTYIHEFMPVYTHTHTQR